jgi:hypothetical protein
MLICNGVRAGGGPMRYHGGNSALAVDRARFATAALAMGFNLGEATVVAGVSIANASGIPAGVRHPQAWVLPIKGGAIKSYRRGGVTVAASATGEMGLARGAVCTIQIDAQAVGGLVASASGSATVSVNGQAAIVATLSSACSATVSINAAAIIDAQASLGAQASITVNGTAQAMGLGSMSASTVDNTTLTAAGIAAAVWNALQADHIAGGTMGEALNTAGSGGLSPAQAAMLRELFELHGLDPAKPLVVSPTARTAGDLAQTVAEAAGTTTVTRVP